MKIIDLLNKMANEEKLPKKILIRDEVYYLINDTDGDIVYSQATDKRNWEAFIDHRLSITRCLNEEVLILDTGVEISEEDTIDIESIEELENEVMRDDWRYYVPMFFNKINELVQAVEQLNKEIKELKSLNIEICEKDINKAIKKAREQRNKSIKEKEYCQVCGVKLTEENKYMNGMCNGCKYGEE